MQVISLTDAAAARVQTLVSNSETPVFGLRIGVKTVGCSGLSYVVEYADAPREGEDVVEEKGVSVCIEPKAVIYLFGAEVDYVEGKLESGFVFRNPNEKSRCGCGESFSV
ncbi:MAG: iron-sulfur cluster assembly accessory protein [Rhodospirillales bacterium]|jgi:iron-sulfur cluster assembly protein|nr:iron-sulfur cluster assembly accessory protein [Rhodospirillales bacterium]MDP6805137.1 iron-sulfur cluster assembly accessory protein [Rhodospirillales bacterium]